MKQFSKKILIKSFYDKILLIDSFNKNIECISIILIISGLILITLSIVIPIIGPP